MSVRQLRVVVEAADYDEAVTFYRDVLGMPVEEVYETENGRVTILGAGRATLELSDPAQVAYIDAVEVGRRVAGHIRLALEVDDARAATRSATDGGAELLAEPTRTRWSSLNSRMAGPADLQLTLFQELG